MRLGTGEAYLSVRFAPTGSKHTLAIYSNLSTAARAWTSATRVSPIVPVLDIGIGDERPQLPSECELFLVGPMAPWRVREFCGPETQCWVGVGNYNVLMATESTADAEAIKTWLKHHPDVGYEIWSYNAGTFKVKISGQATRAECDVDVDTLLEALPERQEPFAAAPREAILLLTSVFKDCARANPSLLRCLREAEQPLKELLSHALPTRTEPASPSRSDHRKARFEALTNLTNTNTALSQIAAQALAYSPLCQCPSLPIEHSLLGVGTAVLAVTNLYRFVHRRVGEKRIDLRFKALAHVALQRTADGQIAWPSDPLATAQLSESDTTKPLFSLLVYLNELEHFRSTRTTLTFPVSIIGGANTTHWSLITMTHEVSHRIIRGVLNSLLPLSSHDIPDLLRIWSRPEEIKTLLDELRRQLAHAMVRMDAAAQNGSHASVSLSSHALEQILIRQHHEAEEIMVHVFDHLFFYSMNDEQYVRGIWSSWSVLPNLDGRIPEYIMRTLCAIAAANLDIPNWQHASYEVLHKHLTCMAAGEGGSSEYIKKALKYLECNWSQKLKLGLLYRLPIIRLVAHCVHSVTLVSDLSHETKLIGDEAEHAGYPHRPLVLDECRFDNPLRWLAVYTTDSKPSLAHAIWMLQLLAFNVDERATAKP